MDFDEVEEAARAALQALSAHRLLFEALSDGQSVPSLDTIKRHHDICETAIAKLSDALGEWQEQ